MFHGFDYPDETGRALANVGQGPVLSGSRAKGWERSLDALVTAAATLADQRIGALIAIERSTPLGDLIEIGTPLNATLSKELLKAIFSHGSPIHDGAVLVRGGEVVAAGCFLPIKLSADIAQELGTRHRAAILTAESDAVVIVVSEETGALGLAVEGRVLRNLDPARLHARLTDLLTPSAAPHRRWLPWWSRSETL